MKRIVKSILIGLFIILVLLGIFFWNQISTGYEVYSKIDHMTQYLNDGKKNYNLVLSGTLDIKDNPDSLSIAISYDNNEYFLADVNYKGKQYTVKSENDSTHVYMGPSNLIIAGGGNDAGEFDFLKLLGDILKNYPQTKKITQLSLFEKIGVAGWTVSNSNVSDAQINNEEFKVLSFDIDSSEVKLLISEEKNEKYLVKVDSRDLKADLKLELKDDKNFMEIARNDSTKFIKIERKELNTAIYRGALRTGGLLLAKIEAPAYEKVEKTYKGGKLTYIDGNRVLIAKGNHRELGQIQGEMLKNEIRNMVDATLYTMCWFYTASRKSWFIDDFRDAYNRLKPFVPKRYDDEMIGLSETSGISIDEIRLTNVFPALFHCSGFALFNTATIDGKLYHGRVLDYMLDIGLQFNAVVFILKPDGYNAFANIGYAGFIGSVTGMNEKQVSFGEMGGRGEGDWDGMPMGFLMRDGLERANTLDDAIKIFRDTPRTCEYYYVIADGKIPDARGLATTPTKYEIIMPNQFHEQLTQPVENTVLMSAGNRYKELVKKVKEGFGSFDPLKSLHLMDRPVAMKSNLHNALFAPQSLDFWVSNAGVNTPAANEPYTHYNLKDLLLKIAD